MAGGSYGETLRRPGFQPFLWTQFLGAFNDNVCKIVVTFLTFEHFGAEDAARPSSARCSSCRSCSSPATPGTSRTSSASARVLIWMQGASKSSRWPR